MDTTTRLDELLGKPSKLSDKQAKEAATLLLSLYTETKDETKTADYLMKFKASVCLYFFERAVKALDTETQIRPLYSAICLTEIYQNNKNHSATTRGFTIAAILIKNGLDIGRNVLAKTLADVEKDGRYTEAVVNLFRQYVVAYCGSLEPVKALCELENPANRSRLKRLIEAADITVISPSKPPAPLSPPKSADLPPPVQEERQQALPTVPNTATKTTNELLEVLLKASNEANILLESLRGNNGTISLLRKDIADRDAQITKLLGNLQEKDNAIRSLQHELDRGRRTASENEERIADLSERLKNSIQMSNITQSQELVALKTGIQKSMQVEYADYLIVKESECDPDTYAVLLGSLSRIFKTLRRFGIPLD